MVKMWSIDCIRIFRLLIHKKYVYMFDVYLVWCRKSWVFLGIPRHQCGSATDEDSCGLCSQSRETIDHLLISCPFSREVWFNLLRKLGWDAVAPNVQAHMLVEWWGAAKDIQKKISGNASTPWWC